MSKSPLKRQKSCSRSALSSIIFSKGNDCREGFAGADNIVNDKHFLAAKLISVLSAEKKGFTMFFTLALVFELGQKAAVVILSAAAAAFIFSLFFKSVRRDFVIPTACITAAVAVILSFAAALVPSEASENFNDSVHTVKASVVSLEEQSGERYYTELKTSEIDGEKYKLNIRLSSKSRLGFKPYDTVEGDLQLYDIGKTRDARNYYLSENIFMGGYTKGDMNISQPERKPIGYYPLAMRAYIKNTLSHLIPGERGALATALLIGDKSDLPKSVSDSFSSAGNRI